MSVAGLKLKEKKPGQRACDEKDAKGKLCCGHLKRWYTPSEDVVRQFGKNTDIYRCERCHTLYRPSPEDHSSAELNYETRPVNLFGDTVRTDSKK